ncbi:MAG TPA: hypothetical protein VJB35_02490 [Candidatus Nanoarchaeia archaeon]|nr:hypothetical protein [Candidatus Nanoarchaeia archaeon]
MIDGGKGGAKTNVHGLAFEKRVDLRKVFEGLEGYEVRENDLYFEGKIVGKFYKKHGLYSELLKEYKIDISKRISKKLLPDETLLVLKSNTLFIIEMKFQKISGSVDEKLQTCDFKLKQYQKILKDSSIKVKYIYVLNDWFKKPEYKDTLDYIKSVNCDYYFNELKFSVLGLPEIKK